MRNSGEVAFIQIQLIQIRMNDVDLKRCLFLNDKALPLDLFGR